MNLKKIAIAINALTFPLVGLATDYGDVVGSQNFNNGDTAQTILTNAITDAINVSTGGITVTNNGNGSTSNPGVVRVEAGTVNLGTGSKIKASDVVGSNETSALVITNSTGTTQFTAKDLEINVANNSNAQSVSGIEAKDGVNSISLDGTTKIDVSSTGTASSFFSGISLSGVTGDTTLTADKLFITVATGNTNDAIRTYGISTVGNNATGDKTLSYNSASIEVTAQHGHAIGINNADGVINGKDTTINVTGGSGPVIYADPEVIGISNLSINKTGKITLTGDTAINLKSGADQTWMVGIDTTDNGAQFSQQGGALTINLDTNGYADNDVFGLRAEINGHIDAKDLNKLAINSLGNASTNSAYIMAAAGGKVTVNTKDLSLGINGINSGENVLAASSNGNIELSSAKTQVKGNLFADAGSITFNGANGTFTGQAITENNGRIELNLTNNMTWQMTGNSDVNTLSLKNSNVDFKSYSETGHYGTLTVANLIGGQNATFNMNANINTRDHDSLLITDSSSGNYHLAISNQGASPTTGAETITMVEDNSTNRQAKFTSNTVELGGYQYGLRQNGNKWELTSARSITSTADAAANFVNTNYLLTYIDTQTLLQRMGELRSNEGQEGNFWARGFSGKLNAFASNKLHGFDMDYNGVQVGIDKLITTRTANFYVGTMVGYTDGDPNYKHGSGGARDINAGLYGSYIDNSGFYIDSIVKYTRFKNNFSVSDSVGQNVKGKSKTNGYGLSLETGKRFTINSTNFYLEPQLQLSYSHQSSDTVKASNGLKVKLDSYDSLLGRGSLIAGYQIKQDDNPIDVYVKSGYVREFKGNTAYYLNDSKEKHDFKGGWVDSAVGVTAQFNKHHNIYAEVSYANGNRFDKQQANIGYRFQF